MTDTTDTTEEQGFNLFEAPMATSRTDGWAYFRSGGDVFESMGIYFFTSAEAVQFAHHHPEIFSSAKAFGMIGSPVPMIPLAVDPPDHRRYRRVLDPMFAPRVVNTMETELRRQVGELIDAFVDRGSCDVMADVARLYPTQVFLTLFGMPLEDRGRFMAWVRVINDEVNITGGEQSERHKQATSELFAYVQDFAERKREAPGDDVLSRVLALEGDAAWSDEEILGFCYLFVVAGLDTVTGAIGFVMLHLASDVELRRKVVADPDLAGRAIEEILRLELSAPMTPRFVTEDVEVCGHHIPQGSLVQLVLGAANRDPERFACPNEVAVDEADRAHLAFGGGIHRCLGSHLARRELRLVVEEFHKRIPDYGIAPGAEPAITWPAGTFALQSLPLVWPTTRQ
jgi:cytochrome P450